MGLIIHSPKRVSCSAKPAELENLAAETPGGRHVLLLKHGGAVGLNEIGCLTEVKRKLPG